jgi:hypothetical protein
MGEDRQFESAARNAFAEKGEVKFTGFGRAPPGIGSQQKERFASAAFSLAASSPNSSPKGERPAP